MEQKYKRIQSYGSMASGSDDDMIVHSQLYPYQKRMLIEEESTYERDHPPFHPLSATIRIFGHARLPFLLGVLLVLYMAYLVAGALVFSALEAPLENQIRLELIRAKQDFMALHPNVSDQDLDTLLQTVLYAHSQGISAVRNDTQTPNWSFGQSFFFVSTVVTTVGYGHITPLSKLGKLNCALYALFGIPFTLIVMSSLVERLLKPTTALLKVLNANLGHLFRPLTIRITHLTIMVSLFVGLFLALPAMVFAYLEPGWDYGDALYYCVMSLTTVGLGDYIPGESPQHRDYRSIYKVMTSFYLFIGITFLMLIITVFYDIEQLNISSVFASTSEDPEKAHLNAGAVKNLYTLGMKDAFNQHDQRRSVVQIRPHHQDDSPSPEDTTPVHAKDIRIHCNHQYQP